MSKSYSSVYEKTTVVLDGHHFEDCTFRECVIIYKGTSGVNLIGCKFYDCQWKLDGAAANTLQFLRTMYQGMGDFGKAMVEETFKNIKK
ncbi:hypothetical protein [Pantoea eucalypti]|uniref:hypothetical protein n=1 Tax=Pantoea eucalypti TaxID=470933 RepID=UPI000999F9CE|nr:hypothetical protein [Pantoea eucalypti]SKA20059.1 hypothetical protein SAMN03097723_3559 [Pantoea eucalypti]